MKIEVTHRHRRRSRGGLRTFQEQGIRLCSGKCNPHHFSLPTVGSWTKRYQELVIWITWDVWVVTGGQRICEALVKGRNTNSSTSTKWGISKRPPADALIWSLNKPLKGTSNTRIYVCNVMSLIQKSGDIKKQPPFLSGFVRLFYIWTINSSENLALTQAKSGAEVTLRWLFREALLLQHSGFSQWNCF